MKSKNLNGIIYRIFNSSESDKIIYVIDKNGSKNLLLAKGVKKLNSKKAHAVDLCNLINAKFIDGYNIPICTEIKLINDYSFKKNLDHRAFFLQLYCEIIDKFCLENNSDPTLYKIFLEILENTSQNHTLLSTIFIIKILFNSGNLGEINKSAISFNALKESEIFYNENVLGFISKDDFESRIDLTGEKINPVIAKVFMFICNNSINKCLAIKISNIDATKMLTIALNWCEVILEQKLKSKAIVLPILNKF